LKSNNFERKIQKQIKEDFKQKINEEIKGRDHDQRRRKKEGSFTIGTKEKGPEWITRRN